MTWKASFLLLPQNVWGCLAKVSTPLPKKIKLGFEMMDCIFIYYALNSSAYSFMIYKSEIPDIHVNMIIESRNDVFFKDVFPYKRKEDNTFEKEHKVCRLVKSLNGLKHAPKQ